MTRDETFDRSRRLEWSLVVVRWAGAGLGAYLVTQSASSMEAAPPLHVKVVGESLIGLLAIGNVIVMAAIGRCRTARSLRILGAAAFGLDSVVVFGLIWSSSYTPSDTTWVVMYMLPLEGALRYGLPGALGLAGVGLASELGREGYLAARFAGYHYELGAVAFRAGIGSLVALVAGLMARGLAREAEHAKWEAGRSEEVARREAAARREANAFNSIILAGLAASELDESLQMMAVAIAFHLELDTFVILIREKDELVARALSGLPSKLLGERVVVGDGVTGWVAATRTPLLVDDVTTFHGYIQVD
ncbi:MAG TPA: hypothetical protein VF972_11680, partial [Actinomycetota bacterium]